MKVKVLGAVILSSLFVITVPVVAMADDTMSSPDTMQAPAESGTNATTPNANVGATPPTTAPTTPNNSPSDDMSADTATGDDDY